MLPATYSNASALQRQWNSIPGLNSPKGGQIGYTDGMCPTFNLFLHPHFTLLKVINDGHISPMLTTH